MKILKATSIFLFALLVMTSPAMAEEGILNLKLQILKVDSSISKRIFAFSDWEKLIRNGRLQVLEEVETQGELNKEALIHVGSKVPIAYQDPRVDGYQVQYTDTGVKIDHKTTKLANGFYRLRLRPERSTRTPGPNRLDPSNVMIVETDVVLKRNQVAVLGAWRGVWVPQYVNTTYPNVKLTEKDTVFVAITLR